jgi:hypothetical protein
MCQATFAFVGQCQLHLGGKKLCLPKGLRPVPSRPPDDNVETNQKVAQNDSVETSTFAFVGQCQLHLKNQSSC